MNADFNQTGFSVKDTAEYPAKYPAKVAGFQMAHSEHCVWIKRQERHTNRDKIARSNNLKIERSRGSLSFLESRELQATRIMTDKIKLRDGDTMLIMVKSGEVIHFTPNMGVPHSELAQPSP